MSGRPCPASCTAWVTSMFRRRRRVLGVWLAVLVAVIVARRLLRRHDVRTLHDPRHRVAAGHRPARGAVPGAVGLGRARRVRRRRRRGCSLTTPTGPPCRRRSTRSAAAPTCVGVTDPFATGTISADADDRLRRRPLRRPGRRGVGGGDRRRSRPPPSTAEAAGLAGGVRRRGHDAHVEEPGPTSELIGLGVAIVVLLISFGSVVAMGLPLLTALIGLGIGDDGHHARRQLRRPVVDRADPRHDDRPRRRHRLRACSSSPATARTSPRGSTSRSPRPGPTPPPAAPSCSPA